MEKGVKKQIIFGYELFWLFVTIKLCKNTFISLKLVELGH